MSYWLAASPRDHTLFISSTFSSRILLADDLVHYAVDHASPMIVVADDRDLVVYRELLSRSPINPRRLATVRVEAIAPDGEPITDLMSAIEAASAGFRRQSGGLQAPSLGPPMILLDLDPLFARCTTSTTRLQLLDAIARFAGGGAAMVFAMLSPESIPRAFGDEFLSLIDSWIVCDERTPRGTATLTGSATIVAGDEIEFRRRILAAMRAQTNGEPLALPSALDDYRRGIVLLSLQFEIRFVSQRAARLLVRDRGEVVGKPLSVCLDGVDLATLKREASRAAGGGHASPFIASWRVAPGRYEPREVTVDVLNGARHPVGFIVSIARVETVRGPRAAYRESRDTAVVVAPTDADSDEMLVEESLDALDGTQITRREHEVLLLILQDKSNREISRHLNIAEVTVKKHLTSVYRKLRITNRRELAQSFSFPQSGSGGERP